MSGSAFQRGVVCSPSEVYRFIQHVMEYNLGAEKSGLEKLVGCIWGQAGISKTAIVKQLSSVGINVGGTRVFPAVSHVALAQIEEAGDITGYPELRKREIGKDKDGNPIFESYMGYAPPSWWPKESSGHTVLLFDDFNRADPRILKAIMQLLQDYRSNANDLPSNVTIMLTGNPSDGDTEYMVNEIDKAILTRMCHITMKFDKIDWAAWAEKANIDKRVMSFVLRYPELCDGTRGTRTNPRSIVQFARLIEPLKDLKAEANLLNILSRACMDDEVATAFEKFAVGDFQHLVDPEEILNNYEASMKKVEALKKGKSGKPREDLIGIIVDRFFVYLMQDNIKLNDKQKKAFVQFIQRTDLMPQDMVYMFLRRLRAEALMSGDEKKNQFVVDLVNAGGDEVAEMLMQIL
jgi:hypothetical protein